MWHKNEESFKHYRYRNISIDEGIFLCERVTFFFLCSYLDPFEKENILWDNKENPCLETNICHHMKRILNHLLTYKNRRGTAAATYEDDAETDTRYKYIVVLVFDREERKTKNNARSTRKAIYFIK